MKIDSRFSIEAYIGFRYFKNRKTRTFISIITVISVLGVLVGVMTLLVVLAVMSGFDEYLQDRIIGINSDIIVSSLKGKYFNNYKKIENKLDDIDEVLHVGPVIIENVLLKSEFGSTGILLKGVVPEKDKNITRLYSSIIKGRDNFISGNKGIFIGIYLARQLGVSVGDHLIIIPPGMKISALGVLPGIKKVKVSGIFKSGMYEYDSTLAYIDLKQAQELLNRPGAVTELAVKIKDFKRADEIAGKIDEKLGFIYYTRSWLNMNMNLFKALKLEKVVMFIILTFIIGVGALNIASTLIVMVIEKTREIGILRALGASKKIILRIFLYKGMFIGGLGTFLGLVFGLLIVTAISYYKITIPGNVYYIDYLPVKLDFFDVFAVCITAIIITLAASVYPSYRAAKLDPVEAIRYE